MKLELAGVADVRHSDLSPRVFGAPISRADRSAFTRLGALHAERMRHGLLLFRRFSALIVHHLPGFSKIKIQI
jgi:hypothetical protein